MRKIVVIAIILLLVGAGGTFAYRHWLNVQEDSKAMERVKVGSTLALNFEVERECQFGDLDIILADLRLNGKLTTDDLLVSVEPIIASGSTFKRVTKRLTGAKIAAGHRMQLPFQAVKQTEHLGVFLCLDRKRTGRCSDKAIYDYGQLEQSIRADGDKKVRASDKIYFFQYLLAEPGAVSFLTENVESLDEAFRKVDESTSGITNAKVRDALRKKAKRLFDALGSYVVIKKPEQGKVFLEARLSKMDQSSCGQARPVVVPQRRRVFRNEIPAEFKDMGFGGR